MSPASKKLNGAARAATDWIGSVPSLLVHTVFFIGSFALVPFGFPVEQVLLVVTTVVSLEAIYLAIFIQMALNEASRTIDEIEVDIDEIQEDVAEIEVDIDEIQEDIDEIEKDETEEQVRDRQNKQVLDKIEGSLGALILEIEKMKKELK